MSTNSTDAGGDAKSSRKINDPTGGLPNKKARVAPRVWRTTSGAVEFVKDDCWGLPQQAQENAKKILRQREIVTVLDMQYMFGETHDSTKDGEKSKAVKKDLSNIFYESDAMEGYTNMMARLNKGISGPADLEDILNGRQFRLVQSTRLSDLTTSRKRFHHDASNAKTPTAGAEPRDEDIHIVLGPSGSGKTTYAVNVLAKPNQHEKHVTFYLSCPDIVNAAKAAIEQGAAEAAAAVGGKAKAPDAAAKVPPYPVVNKVKDVIRESLEDEIKKVVGESAWSEEKKKAKGDDDRPVLNMFLCLVVDEAGSLPGLLGDLGVLQGVAGVLKELATDSRLVVAGTGYDSISKNLSSQREVFKHWMQPWNRDNFRAAASVVLKDVGEKDAIINAILAEPVLHRLITNGRAAYYTVEGVKVFWSVKDSTGSSRCLSGLIGSIINYALAKYVSLNCVGALEAKDRMTMAYAVFHELDASNRSKEPRFPVFDKLTGSERECIIRQALGVVDIHVETLDGTAVYTGDHMRSVSVSPALSMLLFKLLGVEATVYDNWDGLESTTALHAAYQEVLNNPETKTMGVQLVRLARPVPEPSAKTSVQIPIPRNVPTVYINGGKAPFFDVISKNAGYQSKHNEDALSVTVNLDLELQKGGVLKNMVATPEAPKEDPVKEEDNGKQGEEGDSAEGEEAAEAEEEEVSEEDQTKAEKQRIIAAQEEKARKIRKERGYNEKAFKMGNATLAGFLHAWNSPRNAEPNDQRLATQDQESYNIGFKMPAFLFPTILGAEPKENPRDNNTLVCKVTSEGAMVESGRVTIKAEFESPYYVYIVTNAPKMCLKAKNRAEKVVVKYNWVDVDGKFREGGGRFLEGGGVRASEQDKEDMATNLSMYAELLKHLDIKENVYLRFIFTGSAK